MAPPERFTETQIEELLQQLARRASICDGEPYAKNHLVAAFEEVVPQAGENVFIKFRALAQASGQIASVDVTVEGTRKWRLYTFDGLSELVAKRDPTAPQAGEPVVEKSATRPRSNDHPEDRTHIFAHAALLLARRCIGVSLPKVSGSRSRGNSLHENPDFVGVRVQRLAERSALPEWLDTGPPPLTHVTIGAEIKPSIGSSSELSKAVRQALHNSRYFDERWLLAPVSQSLHAEASALGEEYNVGIITLSLSPTARHQVIWNPRPVESRSRLRDFVARYDTEEVAAFCERLEACRRVAEKLSDALREDLVRQLLSDQRDESLLRRLPSAFTESLVGEPVDDVSRRDIEALAVSLRSALVAAYDYDAPEEQDVGEYVSVNVGQFVRSTGIPVSDKARTLVVQHMKNFLNDAAEEARAFADALRGPTSA